VLCHQGPVMGRSGPRGCDTLPVYVPRVLRPLPDEDRKRLLRAARVNTYARREVLVHEGADSDDFHILLEGRVAIRVHTSSGDSAIVNILGPDDHFGEVSLLAESPLGTPSRTATVVALEQVRTMSIPAAVFHDLRGRNPGLEQLVSRLLARRVDELSMQLKEAMYDPLERRVVRRLSRLATTYGVTEDGPVTIPLTQDELGQLVGGTRPSVNQALQPLVEAGLVRLARGRITITDQEALRKAAE
jgi:CRP/FNR family transcriptional regulator, cyclic AMP receptor protein